MSSRKKNRRRIETDLNDDRTSVIKGDDVAVESDLDLEKMSYTKEDIQKILGLNILANNEKMLREDDTTTIAGKTPTDIPSLSEIADKTTGYQREREEEREEEEEERRSEKSSASRRKHHRDDRSESKRSSHRHRDDDDKESSGSRRRRDRERENPFSREWRHRDRDREEEKTKDEDKSSVRTNPFEKQPRERSEEDRDKSDEKKEFMKRKMLDKLDLYRSQNIKVKDLDMDDPYENVLAEIQRIGERFKLKSAIELQREGLINFARTVELVMGLIQPIDYVMEGWGGIMEEDVTNGNYDPIFVEIYDKHADKLPQSPEARLIVSVGLSAFKVASMNIGGRFQDAAFRTKIKEGKKSKKAKPKKDFTMEMPDVDLSDIEKQYGGE